MANHGHVRIEARKNQIYYMNSELVVFPHINNNHVSNLIFKYESNLPSHEHYLSSCKKQCLKKVQAGTGFEPMTSVLGSNKVISFNPIQA